MGKRYDIAIIGSGPAGLEAAINAKIRNKDIIIFGNKELSSKLVKAPKINNYLGFYDISGNELKDKFIDHIDKMGIEITFERINNVYAMGEYFALMVNEKMYEAKTVILATGVEYGKALKGEEEFLGKGVGYCATCDAPLYKNKTVAIIGYNKEAEEEANFVSELASRLYYIPMYRSDYELSEKVEVINDKPIEIVGKQHVEKLILKDSEIEADGIFVLKDSISPAQLVPGLEMEDEHIKVDRKMKTNISGCFAAGDCTGKPYQYIKSAGEGQIAALSAVSYLDKQSS
ncbi:NAD(P)/FAD-dependent oxidoreductase [Clostridium botulinum]|uniref:Oxidoreductase, pyridine nucleotide-disulphide family n=1 Tax=Clostridium botulinum (strain Okra / Type B1) TaxID=498213 RepID=B1IG22_CLOBK|nr:NAD(P)/FAD-dependent oxidoreductase [Clostridium botulinum]EKX80198.1 pyridine nucleotide-disulfide family oxidoreductase [Clostridium botulinum CFSAN001628]ACA43407.1 oxidoreductase, pyridine nucleotide-disulphide family [Clostridium botulinum B1 str. Okra]MBD5561161.1 NAD(P)/FAD-dependent oxidoreductase [Clostridium botulinum]MBD5567540.1 NAD(P)/FAD-dependent oxidoreductase [Clostridium botulinum]MBD5571588.1 NAD(P)/FAD-dependent oxidoreductase [Clostridium botulinum]